MPSFLKTVLSFGVIAGAYVGAKGVLFGLLAATAPSPSELVDAQLSRAPYGAVHQSMRTHFPIEAAQVRLAMIDAVRDGAPNDARRAALAATIRAIHARLADYLRAASDAEIVALIDDRLAMLAPFAEDDATCSAIIMRGMVAISADDPRIPVALLAEAAERLYSTIGRYAMRIGTQYATDADYDALGAALADAGVGAEELTLLQSEDPQATGVCAPFIDVLTVLRDADFDGARRVRAETMVALAEG